MAARQLTSPKLTTSLHKVKEATGYHPEQKLDFEENITLLKSM